MDNASLTLRGLDELDATSRVLAGMAAADGRAAHLYFRWTIARVLGRVAAHEVTRG